MGSATIVPIVLAALGSGGLLTAIAALRKGKIEGKVEGDTSTLNAMSELNERLNADNLLLRQEVRELRAELTALRRRVTTLEHELHEATK